MAPRGVAETAVAHVRSLLLLAAAFLQLLLCAGAAQGAADEAIAERRIKAAYLYRFAGYVTWPDGVFAAPDSPLAIGIWGNDGLADDLAALVQLRTIDNRRIEVRRVREPESLAGLHVLFVGHARNARLAEAAAGSQSRATLVVTETPGALKQGSAINFVVVDGQIRFELSPEAAEKRGLKLSSRLLAVGLGSSEKAR